VTLLKHFVLTLLCALAAVPALRAQQPAVPHAAYVFPAGGRQGASFEVKVAGQYLAAITNAYISGDGVQAVVTNYDKPLTQQQITQLRDQQKALQDKRAAFQAAKNGTATNTGQPAPPLTAEDTRMLAEIRDKLAQNQERSANPVFAENVTLKITIAPDAEPGERELRLGAPMAMSQPLLFCVGQLPEFNKPKPPPDTQPPAAGRPGPNARAVATVEASVILPCVVNGQIMQGGVDRYRFAAHKGEHLVIAVAARELIPYLADAVPGWFQAVLSLYDAQGNEVAYADHFHFHPDPVLYYEVPRDGNYVFQIRDSIYRGREDFVYRITAGELPYLTGLFPLGGPAGAKTAVHLAGWNLPVTNLIQDDTDVAPGVYSISARTEARVSNPLPFAVDTLPECFSEERNHSLATAQKVALPVIINGRIGQPGKWDVFLFNGRAGDDFVAEVIARRLESPLDSVIRLTDAAGQQLAFNDDFEDKGAGLQTQYADSWLRCTLPYTDDYYLWLGDAQHQGGPEFAYRLRLGPPRPDFALRVAPSSVEARGGLSVPLTVYALRRDGFSNAITLTLKDAPAGFTLGGGVVPANQDQLRLTLCPPPLATNGPFRLSIEGRALINGQEVVHPAVPADDRMQAFAYRHLVPTKDLEVSLASRGQFRVAVALVDSDPVKIPAGGTAGVRLRTPTTAFCTNFQLELSEPPDGISIQSVAPDGAGTRIMLGSDAAKTKPGAKGNLIVNVMPRRPPPAATNGVAPARANQARPNILGTLPAIPFEIVAPALSIK
jgi:hypothetical protein